ncbi:hypothetical protein V500_05611, partial [Pseudogymnoascus sp. VKM F-4518 (FW-2643)]
MQKFPQAATTVLCGFHASAVEIVPAPDDGATTEEDVIEERTKAPSPPRRSPRKRTSAQQYLSQGRQILITTRRKIQRLMQNRPEFAQSLQELEEELAQSLQKLTKAQQVIEKSLGSIMASAIDLGALEEDCQYAILPSHIDAHFAPQIPRGEEKATKKPHGLSKATRERIKQDVAQIEGLIPNPGALQQSEFPFPPPTVAPIPALGSPKTDAMR